MINLDPLGQPPLNPEPEKGSGLSILIVEDDADYAESTAILLNMAGHRVEMANTGLAAVSAVVAKQFDVVLLDLGLPGINGMDIAKWVRGKDLVRVPELIALTGHSKEDFVLQAEQCGISHFLTKPIDPTSLTDLLAEIEKKKLSGPDLLII